jgi:sugar/nucleoside kinase (ribokinase family)
VQQSDCTPGQLPAIAELCPRLSILSPNHTEALAMYGRISSPYLSDHQVSAVYPTVGSLKGAIEDVAERLFRLVVQEGAASVNGGWDRGVVVRCGALGCCVATDRYTKADIETEKPRPELTWIDAYWTKDATPDFQDHIVDVTGGGNAFLGGLSAGWKLTNGDLLEGTYGRG